MAIKLPQFAISEIEFYCTPGHLITSKTGLTRVFHSDGRNLKPPSDQRQLAESWYHLSLRHIAHMLLLGWNCQVKLCKLYMTLLTACRFVMNLSLRQRLSSQRLGVHTIGNRVRFQDLPMSFSPNVTDSLLAGPSVLLLVTNQGCTCLMAHLGETFYSSRAFPMSCIIVI